MCRTCVYVTTLETSTSPRRGCLRLWSNRSGFLGASGERCAGWFQLGEFRGGGELWTVSVRKKDPCSHDRWKE